MVSHPNVAVPGDLPHDVRRHSEIEQQRHGGVTKVMEAEFQTEPLPERIPGPSQVVRLQRGPDP
jgi:hypothetical protein